MNTQSKILLAAAGVALLVPAFLLAQTAERHASRLGGGHFMARRIAQKLDLTPAEIQQIKGIFAQHKQELATDLAAVKSAREQQFEAIHADTFAETAVRTAAAAVGQADANLAVTQAKIFGEVRQVLTPEQQAKLKELLADAKAFGEEIYNRIQGRLDDPLAGL
jgi:protein CpxP